MKNFRITYFFLLCIAGAYLAPMHAQESCYEQYLREHNKKILTAEDADDSYDELKKTVLAKQMYGDSYLLMVDTIAQRVMITKVDGTYIADVHVALVDSTWYMWLSVDPLADKYPGNTPYMYCNGNPIMLVDPDGKTWTDVDGNEIADHSNIKVYIFYDPQAFSEQSIKMYKDYEKLYGPGSVALSDATTEAEFKQDWADMSSSQIGIQVNLNYHGSNQAIHLDASNNQYITSTGDGMTNASMSKNHTDIKDLPKANINYEDSRLYINSCHSALAYSYHKYRIRGSMLPIYNAFIKYTDFDVIRGTPLGVSYNRITQHPVPRFGLTDAWLYFYRH